MKKLKVVGGLLLVLAVGVAVYSIRRQTHYYVLTYHTRAGTPVEESNSMQLIYCAHDIKTEPSNDNRMLLSYTSYGEHVIEPGAFRVGYSQQCMGGDSKPCTP